MLSRWHSEYIIGDEGTPCNIQFIEMIEDYDFNEGMMERTSHLMFILPFLDNKFHLIYALEKVVAYVKHPYPSEMH